MSTGGPAGGSCGGMASDEYPADPDAIRAAGLAPRPYTVAPPGVTCATVHERREENRVNRVRARVVFGTLVAVALALVRSAVRRAAHTSPVERHNGTDRNRCRRKARKGFGFSKDRDVHRAAARFSHFSYNFCRRSGR